MGQSSRNDFDFNRYFQIVFIGLISIILLQPNNILNNSLTGEKQYLIVVYTGISSTMSTAEHLFKNLWIYFL